MPPASSDIKSSTTDALRLQSYRTQLETQNQLQLKDIQERHDSEVTRLLETQNKTKNALQSAYDLQISQEAEDLDTRLSELHKNNENRITQEKVNGDQEIEKLKKAQLERVREYKKNADAQLTKIQKEMQTTTENLHQLAKKSAKRDKEVPNS